MNRKLTLSLLASTVVGLALVPSATLAQQQSLKDQLPGTWLLTSCEPAAGSFLQEACKNNPTGSLGFSPTGRYTEIIMAGGRQKGSLDRASITPEQYKAIAQGVVANFGTYSVNEADKTITGRSETSLMFGTEATELKSNISITGDELKSTSKFGTTTWKRSGPAFTVSFVSQNTLPRGIFQLNLAKSKYSPGPAPKSTTLYSVDGKATTTGIDADGNPRTAVFTTIVDGKPHPVTGVAAYDENTLARVDAHTVNISRTKAGKVVQTATMVTSQDGRTITFTATGTDEKGQQINNTTVWEKQ